MQLYPFNAFNQLWYYYCENEWVSSFRVGLGFTVKYDWGSYIISVGKIAKDTKDAAQTTILFFDDNLFR